MLNRDRRWHTDMDQLRGRLTQLLDDPLGCRVAGHVEVQYPAPPVLDHKEAVQQLERDRWYSEEIECGDDFAMIMQERQPAAGRITATTKASPVAPRAPLRHHNAHPLDPSR